MNLMKMQALTLAATAVLVAQSALAQNLVLNGDFETLALDDLEMREVDDFGKAFPTDWFRSVTDPNDPNVNLTELIGPANDGSPNDGMDTAPADDSDGIGTNSVALNPSSLGLPDHSDWRSEKFATVPDETLDFSFDFKFIGAIASDFQQFRIELRSYDDEVETTFAGEQTLFVSPVGYTITGMDPVTEDFNDGQWHTLGFSRVIPSIAGGSNADGNFSDVRVSINAFTTLTEGQVRIDNVSVTRPIPGDYNGNGTVDAADYVAWRNAGPTDTLPNDPTPGTVDASDYDFWKANFGAGAAGGGASLGAVPEPSCLTLGGLLVALAVAGRWHTRL